MNTKKLQAAKLLTTQPAVEMALTRMAGSASSGTQSFVGAAPGERLDLMTTVSLAEGTCVKAKLVLCHDESVALTAVSFDVDIDSSRTSRTGRSDTTLSSKCPHGVRSSDSALMLSLGDIRQGAGSAVAVASTAVKASVRLMVTAAEGNIRGQDIRLVEWKTNGMVLLLLCQ